jgi:C4-dicarboxylate transporter, DctQ subunit
MTPSAWSLDRAMSLFETIMIATLATAAFVVGVMQIVLRYVFNTGFPWSEGIFITLTMWAVMFGASRAVRDRMHIRVDVFVKYFPSPLRKTAYWFANLLSFGLCVFFAYCGFLYTLFVWQMDVMSIESSIPEWIIFSLIPLSMTAFSIRYIQVMWRDLKGIDADGGEDDMGLGSHVS